MTVLIVTEKTTLIQQNNNCRNQKLLELFSIIIKRIVSIVHLKQVCLKLLNTLLFYDKIMQIWYKYSVPRENPQNYTLYLRIFMIFVNKLTCKVDYLIPEINSLI